MAITITYSDKLYLKTFGLVQKELKETYLFHGLIANATGVELHKLQFIVMGKQTSVGLKDLEAIHNYLVTSAAKEILPKIPNGKRQPPEIHDMKRRLMRAILDRPKTEKRMLYVICKDAGLSVGVSTFIKQGNTTSVSIGALRRLYREIYQEDHLASLPMDSTATIAV